MSELLKIFISYSHDSEEHKARVQRLANRLRRDGVKCEIDQYEPFPPEGWPAWMRRQLDEADFVLVACTQTYFQRLTEDERPGVGLGARFEGGLIEQYLYEAKGQNQKFIPILFDGLDAKWIPKVLGRYSRFRVDTEDGYTTLFRYLTKQPAILKPEVGTLKHLPPSEITDETKASHTDITIGVKALPSAIGRNLRRRWRWSVAVALLTFVALWWIWYHQPSRLYDKGRQAMAVLDFPRARILFEEALAKNNHPVVRSALAEVLMRLGKNGLAIKESESASKQSEKLSSHDRLLVRARYERIRAHWHEALFRYKELQKREPAEVEYAIGIAETQIALDYYADALATIKAMQETSTDPRLDLAEGIAAYYLYDFSGQVDATTRAINKAESQGVNSLASEGYLLRGNAFLRLGKLDRAHKDFKAAEERAGENLEQIARARNSIAQVLGQQGDLKNSLYYYEGARKAYRQAGNKTRADGQTFYLASIYEQQGNLRQARKEYEAALNQPRDPLSRLDEGRARGGLGTILALQGHLIEAMGSLEAAIVIFEGMGDQEQKAGYLCRLSRVQLESLELKPAEVSWQKCDGAAKSRKDQKDPLLEADVLFFQGLLLFFQGNLEAASKAQQSAMELYKGSDENTSDENTGDKGSIAQSQLALAEIELERDQTALASSQAQAALDYFYDQQALDDMAKAKVLLARAFLLQGMPKRAQPWIEQAKRRVVESKRDSLVLRVQVSLVEARALAALGNVPEARKIIQRELNDPRNLGYPKLRMETQLAQGEIEILYGDRNQGRELLSLVEEDARERGFKLVETKAARLRAGS